MRSSSPENPHPGAAHRGSGPISPHAEGFALLRVSGLSIDLDRDSDRSPDRSPDRAGGDQPIVRNLDLEVGSGEIVGLVGESGCGKSLTALAVLGLLPTGLRISSGRLEIEGVGDLLKLSPKARRHCRGQRMAMVFQDPLSALDPLYSIGSQIVEALRIHRQLGRGKARQEAVRLLQLVAMPDPETRFSNYPHELSGGQCQRALLALALAGQPDLLLADEPTTALDASLQQQILALLCELRRDLGLSVLLISHDLGVVASICDRVLVMYAGEIVEQADAAAFFAQPSHPYSKALLAAIPRLGSGHFPNPIPGRVPQPGAVPKMGCAFAPRCPSAQRLCRENPIPWVEVAPDHRARCILAPTLSDRGSRP